MKVKLTGSTTAAMAVFVISTGLASILGVRQYERLTSHLAWVARDNLAPGLILDKSMLEQQRVDNNGDALPDLGQILGKQLRHAKQAGEPVMAADVQRQARTWLSQKVPDGRVLYTLTPRANAIPPSQLKGGDAFDVLVTGPAGVRTVAQNVRLMGVMKPRSGQGQAANGPLAALTQQGRNKPAGNVMVIAVMPEDVYPLASIHPAESVSLVLHSAASINAGEPVSVRPPASHRAIELVFGSSKQSVKVKL